MPGIVPEVEPAVRRALFDRFPYKVYFCSKGPREVRILAAYHVNRDPVKWQDRPAK